MRYAIAVCLFSIVTSLSHGQNMELMLRTDQGTLKYLVSFPEEYSFEKEKNWPVMFFLHGAGERGDDLSLVKTHGPPKLVEQGKNLPFIVISPQLGTDKSWASYEYLRYLDLLYKDIMSSFRVDKDRVYLTGLSMGGQGTWEWAKKRPDWFAAIAPICGFSIKQKVKKLKRLPIWVFHGAKDQTVPIERSDEMVNWLKKYDTNVKYTIYPEANHDSWTETYNNPELYEWFLSYSK